MRFYGRLQEEQEQKVITINEAFKQYQTYNVARNLSPKTIEYYQDTIERFLKFYDGKKNCDTITQNTIYEYIAYIRTNCKVKDITINTRLRSVRSMCYYFIKMALRRFKWVRLNLSRHKRGKSWL